MSDYKHKYILNFITRILHPKTTLDGYSFPLKQKLWEQVLKIGSSHLVLPAIYAAMIRKKIQNHVPKDLLLYLKKISNLNKKET